MRPRRTLSTFLRCALPQLLRLVGPDSSSKYFPTTTTSTTVRTITTTTTLTSKPSSKTNRGSYTQGQTNETDRSVREYFYFIDHQGQLFLDDAKMKNFTSCYKEKDFLRFFFKRLKVNRGERYREFPYVSPCGPELNYLRCDDRPIVFTKVLDMDGETMLSYNNAEEKLVLPFRPEDVCMLPETGRVYHTAPSKLGGIGLVKSALAIEWSRDFQFDGETYDPPSFFTWKGKNYKLNNSLLSQLPATDLSDSEP